MTSAAQVGATTDQIVEILINQLGILTITFELVERLGVEVSPEARTGLDALSESILEWIGRNAPAHLPRFADAEAAA